jgi:hypothetical protein
VNVTYKVAYKLLSGHSSFNEAVALEHSICPQSDTALE